MMKFSNTHSPGHLVPIDDDQEPEPILVGLDTRIPTADRQHHPLQDPPLLCPMGISEQTPVSSSTISFSSPPPPPPPRSSTLHPSSSSSSSMTLPWLLRMLFGLNALTISLLTLPLQYIVNTRVRLPLPYLPTYGAIAFLPWSLKPIYAYLTTTLTSSRTTTNRQRQQQQQPIMDRSTLFLGLMTLTSLWTALYTFIPSQGGGGGGGGILWLFMTAVGWGMANAWAEFCIGLALIDHARSMTFERRMHDDNNDDDRSHTSPASSSSGEHFDTAVAQLQTQAASSRNIGSFVATLLTFGLFLQRYLVHPDSVQLSEGVVDAMFIATSLLLLLGICVASVYRQELMPMRHRGTSTDGETTQFTLLQRSEDDRESGELTNAPMEHRDDVIDDHNNEATGLCDDEEGSNPSYSSLDDEHHGDNDSLSSTESATRLVPPTTDSSQYTSRANLMLIVLLQAIIIVIAVRDPMSQYTSHFAWKVLVVSLVLALGMTALSLYLNRGWKSSHRVGLFLILRNTVPNEMILVSSFYYTVFQAQPLLLQLISIVGTGVLTLSSWSYNKLLAKYSSGRPFLLVLAGTAVVAAASALLNIVVYRTYVGPSTVQVVLVVALVAKFFGNFFYEWGFLPQVILATKSLSLSSPQTRPQETRALGVDQDGDNERRSIQRTDGAEEHTIAMEYGSFISCIDFGDQLGSMAAAPLVALLDITRENDFLHLDRLILICVLLKMIVSVGLLPLLPKKR